MTLSFIVVTLIHRLWLLIQMPNISTEIPREIVAVKHHFWEYIWFYHTKPIGGIIKLKMISSLVPDAMIPVVTFHLTFAVSWLSALLVFLFLRRIGTWWPLAFAGGWFWSYLLFFFDHWRGGGYYDHFNPFLMIGWGLSLLGWLKAINSSKKMLIHGLFLLGLYLFFSGASVFLLLSIGAVIVRQTLSREKAQIPTILGALGMVAFCQLLPLKVYLKHGQYTTSTVAGQNGLQFTMRNLQVQEPDREGVLVIVNGGEEKIKERMKGVKSIPDWYWECFNQAENWLLLLYGHCGKPQDLKGIQDEPAVYAKVLADAEDLRERPWLFDGGVHGSNSRFAIEYGKYSGVIWKKSLLSWPKDFIGTFKKAAFHFFLWPENFFYGNNVQLKYEMPQSAGTDFFFTNIRRFSKLVLIAGILIPFLFLLCLTSKYRRAMADPMVTTMGALVGLYCGLFIGINGMTCCENARMAVGPMILPFFLMVASLDFAMKKVWLLTRHSLPRSLKPAREY